jgi:pyruvate formate lyase activating enzyme
VSGGRLVAAAYGQLSSTAVDPIEKKPLYHFRPGSSIFSVGGWGCNLRCQFCQNWQIAQNPCRAERFVAPRDLIADVQRSGCGALAYTYNEPLVGYEYVYDCARLAEAAGIANVLVTNGFANIGPVRDLLPHIAAINLDIKSMDDEFYRTACGGRLAPVLAFAREAVAQGCHLEITNLVIPGLNDAPEAIDALAVWIAATLGAHTPLHLSAYRPMYRMERPATPVATLLDAHRTASEHLAYVYLGNVNGETGRDTYCPACGNCLVSRAGYAGRCIGLREGLCAACGRKADIRTASARG